MWTTMISVSDVNMDLGVNFYAKDLRISPHWVTKDNITKWKKIYK